MLYNGVLVSALKQSESAIHIHISPYLFLLVSPSLPPSLSHPSRWSQSTKLISLYYVISLCFPLAIHFIFSSVYMSMALSHFVAAYPSPSPCPQVHSLVGLHLYSCPAPRFFITIFFPQIPYICVNIRYLFFSF